MTRDTDDPEPDAESESESKEPSGKAEAAVAGSVDHPIEGQVLLLTAAKASVPADRLPDLLARTQAHLAERVDTYRRRYERVHADDVEAFLVPETHWEELGETLGLERQEWQAVRRAHEEQLLRIGRREDRREEFETALEIRDPVVIAV